MAFILDGQTIKTPNGFKTTPVKVGATNRTMRGSLRRAIRATKYIYTLRYNILTENDYNTIKTIEDKDEEVTFVNSDVTPEISTDVFVDLQERDYIPGTGEYLSVIELVLTEV